MAILENIVKIIMLKLAIILVYLYDSFRPIFICKIFLIILPPSNGYIGNRLNITIKKFVYIIVSACKKVYT